MAVCLFSRLRVTARMSGTRSSRLACWPSRGAAGSHQAAPRQVSLPTDMSDGQSQTMFSRQLESILSQHGLAENLDTVELQLKCPALAQLQAQDTDLVHANVKALETFCTPAELSRIIAKVPAILLCQLAGWFEFLEGTGFSKRDLKTLLSQTPEVLVEGSLVTAGAAMTCLRKLGFDQEGIVDFSVHFPQILNMDEANIQTVVRLTSKFYTNVDQQCC